MLRIAALGEVVQGVSFKFLDAGGEMAAAVRAYDWASTSLGPIEEWGASLRTAVGMMLSSAFPKCIVWGPELVTIYNDAFRPILGDKPEALGRPFSEVWAEAWETIGPIADKAYAGVATFIEDFPLVIDRHGYPEQAWFTFCYSPIRDAEGQVVGMMDTVIETTGKVRTEQNSRLLNAELAHRIKNILAMVSAIASQTFQSAESKEEAKATLTQRLSALGKAHAVLVEDSRSGASVRDVIEGVLSPFSNFGGRISIEGPPIDLSPRQALSLGLAINELATNAVKYGALSDDRGRVAVSWKVGTPSSDEEFRLAWEERGGPAVSKPKRHGFGSRLIEQALAGEFNGKVQTVYDPLGLRCELSTSMMNVRLDAADPAEPHAL
ncbi:signal transduction histidine kinase [Mesorhizobium alhagi CCNWXJ12-2]|uniref:histidine kinase n=2 Tax=Allomesorhizobium alhagi TaxID=475067 RepID=H0HZI9_9HYPH|nr:signal transduction histidine kinase [Mesorhizobium alhagi CCNWXJ12-2]